MNALIKIALAAIIFAVAVGSAAAHPSSAHHCHLDDTTTHRCH